jgi:hypothetical protein
VILNPGPYTAILSGNNSGTGVGLIEIYDLGQGSDSRLGNISTRGVVGTGNDIIIAGFILGGGSNDDVVLMRGIGPSLVPSGVTNALMNPTLELRNSDGAVLVVNDDWQSGPPVSLPPTDPLESAIETMLSPGAYTALLSGVNNGTGVGLVEVYDNPQNGSVTPSPTPTITPTSTPTPSPSPTCPGSLPGATCPPPMPTPTPQCLENFDGVVAPNLPGGWAASNPIPGDGVMFVTSAVSADTAPNDAFIPDQDGISDKVLDRKNVTVVAPSPVLSFRNNYDSEMSGGVFWDGAVLEISAPNISGGDFLDVTDSRIGGTITSGGYTGEISGDASNPLAGRMAWSGNSGGYVDTVITFGPNLVGQTVTLRWRFGSDEAVAAPGWRIDNVAITGAMCP